MKLTGKCKEDFEKWMLINNKDLLKLSDVRYSEVIDMVQLFKYLTPSMKYGVYVDFFDSVGIQLSIHCWDDNRYSFTTLKEGRYMRQYKLEVTTRQESRTAAIEKANEIYNK
jgi:hypothetical protein